VTGSSSCWGGVPSGITADDSYEAPKISPCSLRNSGRGSTASGWRAVRPIDSELARLASVMATPSGCRSAW
jgi:hypothetical protein